MTRRLIMWNLVTLEGYFEGPKKWDLDWHEYVWGDELEQLSLEQRKSADALLFGRVTYEGMASYWPTATGEVAEFMNRVPKVVFSRTLGSADLSAALMRENLFDEYRLCVVPVSLGAGAPLFKSSSERKRMKLRETRTLKSGGVILFCEPDRK
jgi:dihydrofolate reductase